MSRVRQVLAWLEELFRPEPGTPEHREAVLRTVKQRSDERAKPSGQRDEARLLELDKRLLRLSIESRQAKKQLLRRHWDILLQHPGHECCADCLQVRQRGAASCEARAAWHEAWELIASSRLEALEQGQPYPPLVLPYLELHLPEGMPEELPPSTDRCSACQSMLDRYLYLERSLKTVVNLEP
ncbi:hypothetical protein ABPG75_012064 [Micractinium tetrahymenae]